MATSTGADNIVFGGREPSPRQGKDKMKTFEELRETSKRYVHGIQLRDLLTKAATELETLTETLTSGEKRFDDLILKNFYLQSRLDASEEGGDAGDFVAR